MRRISQTLLLALLLSGCAVKRGLVSSPPLAPDSERASSDPLTEELVRADAKFGRTAEALTPEDPTEVTSHPEVLMEVNKSVEKWIAHFSGKARETFTRFLARGSRYKTMVQQILKEHGVPEEFYYLAMIESGYVTHATSNQKAVGIWQFVRGTSERYGLKSTPFVDERRDPARATRAAALYLIDLHNIFGSWHLALCAYNAGEGRIMRAIMKGKSRDFWTLVEKKVLPKETNDYVPIFLAATLIGNDPEKYGFKTPEADPYPEVTGVMVPSPVKLSNLAKAARVSVPELKEFNPSLLRDHTPPGDKSYKIWLPSANAPHLVNAMATLPLLRVAGSGGHSFRSPSSVGKARSGRYRVRSGDTLTGIAERFGMSISGLKKLNRLHKNRIQAGQVLRLGSRT